MKKVTRAMPPDGGLKKPVRKFEDTFSAEAVVLTHFFPNTYKMVNGKAVRIKDDS